MPVHGHVGGTRRSSRQVPSSPRRIGDESHRQAIDRHDSHALALTARHGDVGAGEDQRANNEAHPRRSHARERLVLDTRYSSCVLRQTEPRDRSEGRKIVPPKKRWTIHTRRSDRLGLLKVKVRRVVRGDAWRGGLGHVILGPTQSAICYLLSDLGLGLLALTWGVNGHAFGV